MKALLIVVCIIGLTAVIGAIIVGRNTFEGTVVDKPYERGIAWDAAQKERARSGWTADIVNPSIVEGRNEIIVSVTDREGRPLPDAEVSLTVSRPSTSAYDRTYKTGRTDKGLFKAEINLPLYGYWDVKIQITEKGKTITFEKRIFASQGK